MRAQHKANLVFVSLGICGAVCVETLLEVVLFAQRPSSAGADFIGWARILILVALVASLSMNVLGYMYASTLGLGRTASVGMLCTALHVAVFGMRSALELQAQNFRPTEF